VIAVRDSGRTGSIHKSGAFGRSRLSLRSGVVTFHPDNRHRSSC
jgi:hypothetical protein